MSVFDTLAEIRYEEWLEKVSASDYRQPHEDRGTAVRVSYEGFLFREVMSHLEMAESAVVAAQRERLMDRAGKLELQLMLLLEKRSMPLVASTLAASIAVRKKRLQSD